MCGITAAKGHLPRAPLPRRPPRVLRPLHLRLQRVLRHLRRYLFHHTRLVTQVQRPHRELGAVPGDGAADGIYRGGDLHCGGGVDADLEGGGGL